MRPPKDVQRRLASLAAPLWLPGPGAIAAGGVFVAYARGQQRPGAGR